MSTRPVRAHRLARRLAPVAAVMSLLALTTSGAVSPTSVATAGPVGPVRSVTDCAEPGSAARVAKGSNAAEPALYASTDAKKYGVIKPHALMEPGSVSIPTVFHVVTAQQTTAAQKARYRTLITAQMKVLNDAYAGTTSAAATSSPFRFALTRTTYTANAAWASLAPGKAEQAMKQQLHEGDSKTLNVYVGSLGGGLLGYAYFPKDYNNGRGYLDGVVMLDESMPGGTAKPYDQGDTLTHEVGHWMALEHTFAGACSASGDGVADTPREAAPQFGCPVGADTCTAPGLDPVHNFMDYTEDSCMDMFTQGQVQRMNDAWIEFRAGGNG